jgi:hypothetical protein
MGDVVEMGGDHVVGMEMKMEDDMLDKRTRIPNRDYYTNKEGRRGRILIIGVRKEERT